MLSRRLEPSGVGREATFSSMALNQQRQFGFPHRPRPQHEAQRGCRYAVWTSWAKLPASSALTQRRAGCCCSAAGLTSDAFHGARELPAGGSFRRATTARSETVQGAAKRSTQSAGNGEDDLVARSKLRASWWYTYTIVAAQADSCLSRRRRLVFQQWDKHDRRQHQARLSFGQG